MIWWKYSVGACSLVAGGATLNMYYIKVKDRRGRRTASKFSSSHRRDYLLSRVLPCWLNQVEVSCELSEVATAAERDGVQSQAKYETIDTAHEQDKTGARRMSVNQLFNLCPDNTRTRWCRYV